MLAFVEFSCLLLIRFFFFFFLSSSSFSAEAAKFWREGEVRGERERERMLEGQIKIRIINFFSFFLFCFVLLILVHLPEQCCAK